MKSKGKINILSDKQVTNIYNILDFGVYSVCIHKKKRKKHKKENDENFHLIFDFFPFYLFYSERRIFYFPFSSFYFAT